MPTDIALGIVTFVMAVLGGIVSAHAPAKLWLKVLYVSSFVVLGVVGGFYIVKQSHETAAAQRDAQTAQIKLANSIEKLGKSSEEIQRVAMLNTELQKRLLASTATIGTLATNVLNTTTGGDSFCFLMSIRGMDGQFLVVHHGRYPIYGVQARVMDLVAFEGSTLEEKRRIATVGSNLLVGDMAPRSSRYVAFPFPLPSKGQAYFRLFFNSTRNGFWTEDIQLRAVDGVWVSAIKVTDGEGKEIMHPIVPKDFPKPVAWRP